MFRKVVLACCLIASASANAFFTPDEFFKLYNSPDKNARTIAEFYLIGIMETVWSMNAFGNISNPSAAVCYPETQDSQSVGLKHIGLLALEKARKKSPSISDKGERMPLVVPLIIELSSMYPCAGKR